MKHRLKPWLMVLVLPLLVGAEGDGCASNSESDAPDVTGDWQITYDNNLSLEIKIGGAVYTEETGPQGGVVTINHNGKDLMFDLDCSRPEVLCPSEAWPSSVSIEQRNERFEHRMIVTLPQLTCDGTLNQPPAEECGEGTLNEDCEAVCDGTAKIENKEKFGVIGENGDSFRLFLGAGIATNGVNCIMLAASVADADLVTMGTGNEWVASAMENGVVDTTYAGGCLWAGDPDMDKELEALVIGASIRIRTNFSGQKLSM